MPIAGSMPNRLALCADMLTGMALTNVTEVRHGMTAGAQITLRDGFSQLLTCGYEPSLCCQLRTACRPLTGHVSMPPTQQHCISLGPQHTKCRRSDEFDIKQCHVDAR